MSYAYDLCSGRHRHFFVFPSSYIRYFFSSVRSFSFHFRLALLKDWCASKMAPSLISKPLKEVSPKEPWVWFRVLALNWVSFRFSWWLIICRCAVVVRVVSLQPMSLCKTGTYRSSFEVIDERNTRGRVVFYGSKDVGERFGNLMKVK